MELCASIRFQGVGNLFVMLRESLKLTLIESDSLHLHNEYAILSSDVVLLLSIDKLCLQFKL